MRKKMIGLMSCLLVAAVLSGCGSEKEKPVSEEKRTLVLGFDDTFVPMGFQNAKGEYVGFDIELAREFAVRKGYDLKLQPIDWSMKEAELNAENIDMIWNGYSITSEREKKVAFSQPYMANRQVVVVLQNSDVRTLHDLKGRVVATQAESASVSAARSVNGFVEGLKGGVLVEYPDFNAVFADLETGRADAIIVDEVMARYWMNNRGDDGFRMLSEDLGSEEFAVGMRKNDVRLREDLNAALAEMEKDGTAKTIYERYFSTK